MSASLTTNVDQRLLRTTKFPPEFNQKVDMTKVNIQLIKAWVTDEIARIMKSEDDIVTELVFNILDESRYPNIKELQISLNGFLDKDAAPFCASLWKLCLSAQDSPHGIPKELVEAKKAELAQAKAEEDKQREEAMKRQDRERERDRELASMRERERNERSDRGRGRGGRYGRGFERPRRDSRSPPRRRRDDDDYRRPRGADTYVPDKSRDNERPPRRRRSPSRDHSESLTPPHSRRKRRNSSSEPSRSPPRRRRRYSSDDDRSRSRDRRDRRNGKNGDDDRRRKSRSPLRRRRSPSPRSNRRPSPARSRSPPMKRIRKSSPEPARPTTSNSNESAASAELQSPRKKDAGLAPNDLMSKRNQDANRLSRESSQMSVSRSETPEANNQTVGDES